MVGFILGYFRSCSYSSICKKSSINMEGVRRVLSNREICESTLFYIGEKFMWLLAAIVWAGFAFFGGTYTYSHYGKAVYTLFIILVTVGSWVIGWNLGKFIRR